MTWRSTAEGKKSVENRTATTCDVSTEQHMRGAYICVCIYLFIMAAASRPLLLELTPGLRFVTAVSVGIDN